jgi:UDP-N-acetylglucosamine--N-acetylmuramyl-(pentapeptide) pyrophosphoryl-undecaprenol N-acetylglucosamine transferase
MTMRVAIAGGGTAGHVFPGLALGRTLRDRGHDVFFLGTETGLEATLVPASGFSFHVIRARPFVRRPSLASLKAPLVALGAVRECRRLVRDADVVVGMGGYVSVPGALASRREKRPLVLHEQNAIPGLANRALSRMARTVALTFADAGRFFPLKARLELTGNPVRDEVLRVPMERETLAKEGRAEFDLDEARRTVLIFGGSLGALHLDRAAVGACRILRDRSDLQILLITGPAHFGSVERALAPSTVAGKRTRTRVSGIAIRPVAFVDRMDLAYACADLVVSRSGATTIAELTVCGLPCLLVPYPYATRGHQEANARALQRAGGATVLLDDQLSAESLAERIGSLIDHQERLAAMADGSKAFGRADAADRLADAVERAGDRP